MSKENFKQVGIKYKVVKLSKNNYILFPISAKKGMEEENGFQTNDELISYVNSKKSLKNNFVIDYILDVDEVNYIYNLEDDEEDYINEYFFDDFKDTVIFIDTKGDNLKRAEINLSNLFDENLMFFMKDNIPSLALNEKSVDELLKSDDLDTIKLNLLRLKKLILSFKNLKQKRGVTKINVSNGHVDYIEVAKENISIIEDREESVNKKKVSENISYSGLKKYIKERVIGHDEEIDTFAQKLFMNYTALDGEKTESILLVGPTGTGKTETIKAACNYLNLPSVIVNASNLVTEGIRGTSIEDCLTSLYENAEGNLEFAEKGIIFFDEFDKLNNSNLEIKRPIKDILLTFNDGADFNVNNEMYDFVFNTSMLNKVYAGVFDRINNTKKQIGFNKETKDFSALENTVLRKKIIEAGYFSEEELSRIGCILKFNNLDRDTKKRILLESKLSALKSKLERYKRQFNADIDITDDFIEELLDKVSKSGSMRNLNNLVKETLNDVEKYLLEENSSNNKKIKLTRNTVLNSKKFDC